MRPGRAREGVETRALPTLDPVPARLTPNRAEGRRQAAARGWTGGQWRCLLTLWDHESRWDERADNPTSTAYGIAQFLRATWSDYGPRTSDPARQIRYGIAYISDRYGSPCQAWTAWSARRPHWY